MTFFRERSSFNHRHEVGGEQGADDGPDTGLADQSLADQSFHHRHEVGGVGAKRRIQQKTPPTLRRWFTDWPATIASSSNLRPTDFMSVVL